MTELEFYVHGRTQAALEDAAAIALADFLEESEDRWEVEALRSWAEPQITTMGTEVPFMYRARYVARLRPKPL